MPFPEGQNAGGKPSRKIFAEALRMRLLKPVSEINEMPEKPRVVDQLVSQLILATQSGMNQLGAIKEVIDRVDGKPAQAITNDEGDTFKQALTIVTGVPRE